MVRVDDGKRSFLLTGDIESPAEQKMLSHYWQHLQSTFIQVPHHGSNTSSSLAFVQRVAGQVAVASASRYNARRLPSESEATLSAAELPMAGHASSGAGYAGLFPEKLADTQFADQILPRWYHQWFGVPEDNR